jgi:hypothetical protein
MTSRQAEDVLAGEELLALLEGNLSYVKELVARCLDEDVPALVGALGADCNTKSCGVRAQLLVREGDARRVVELMQTAWIESVAAEGTVAAIRVAPAAELGDGEEPPCPACGASAPLVDGACADCGLQLG